MKSPVIFKIFLIAFAAFLIYTLFTTAPENLYTVMSISFLFGLPFGVGALVIYLSDIEKVRSLNYRIFAPWVAVGVFLLATLLFAFEGWACILMALPLFLLASTAGGLTAGYFKIRKHDREKTYVSILVLLPLFLSPIEHMIGAIPGRYEAYTYIDIKAKDKAQIWDNVTRVKAINQQQDKGWLTRTLGFPRPIRAELNYNGVGAYRKAIFDKGLVFHEEVLRYEDQRRMDFSIKANPYEIPSTTMDKHVVIGGDYFDVLNGTYILQQTGKGTYRLHLYSHFKLTTTFNFYASWWAGWIMSDIQNNILQVIKQRAETGS
ncbi:hypothetical protein HQ865_21220 [Mucilaginibacter mali]|uniref:SRPBCC family protein n=1 Tax=Mucilaginibacter mali TaxID=2740462 RepID=A0A7D4TX95_9SPHI|nr:hypothetical protein [Mucilaginibacter mali]QKJ32175.1 hypothetical protein HQ865_21220 [Mucilaginibacter mali]